MGNKIETASKKERQRIKEKLHKIGETLNFPHKQLTSIKTSTAESLQNQIFSKTLTLPTAIKLLQKLKQLENNSHNAITDSFYKKPLSESETLQKKLEKSEITVQTHPLLGFIFSIKDSNILKNTKTTNGFFLNLKSVYKTQPKTITLLKSQGALITTKGNIPQALFSIESSNNIYKKTQNPHNRHRTSGGSSGGEAALLALGLVNAAIGSDAAGSVRIPALFCGVVGFKPTAGRVSQDMVCQYFDLLKFSSCLRPRLGCVSGTIGPLARSVRDCEAVMRVLVRAAEFDFFVPPLFWKVRGVSRVALLQGIGELPVSEACLRAVEVVRTALVRKGFEIEYVDLNEEFEEFFVVAGAGLMKNEQMIQILRGDVDLEEDLMPAFDNIKKLLTLPVFYLKRILTKLAKNDRRRFLIKARILSLEENTNFIKSRINASYKKFLAKMKKVNCEVLISPGLVTPAVKHCTSKDNNIQCFYTFLFNAFNMPAGVLPITKVLEKEQFYKDNINDSYTKSFKDNMIGSKGLPIGVHVSALPWKDELVFYVMKIIEDNVDYK